MLIKMLHINPEECLLDEYISIKVTHLQPDQHITIRCEVEEGKFVFDSHAHYVASLEGVVDLCKDGSFGGSYKGVSQMGIFWSMLPAVGQMRGLRYFPRKCMQAIAFKIQVYDDHLGEGSFKKSNLLSPVESDHVQRPIVEGVALRRCNAEGVTRHEVRHGRVRGTIFRPPGLGPFKGVIDIYGGAGGINESRVALLASHGFIGLTLPYFRYDDLVNRMDKVEMEYFMEAIEHFTSLDWVQPNIGILGVSSGGPIALFLSTICAKISALVTFGSSYAFFSPMLYQDKTFNCVIDTLDMVEPSFDDKGAVYISSFIDHKPLDEIAIKLERSNAKFLIVGGTDDKAINAVSCGQYMVNRMKKHGKGNQITLLSYPGAGHFADPPYMPLTLVQYYPEDKVCRSVGGDVIPSASASIHCWRETLHFLNRYVGLSTKL